MSDAVAQGEAVRLFSHLGDHRLRHLGHRVVAGRVLGERHQHVVLAGTDEGCVAAGDHGAADESASWGVLRAGGGRGRGGRVGDVGGSSPE